MREAHKRMFLRHVHRDEQAKPKGDQIADCEIRRDDKCVTLLVLPLLRQGERDPGRVQYE